MTDESSVSGDDWVPGQTAGGGGAGAALAADAEIPNPGAHYLDGVEPTPGVSKPDPILVADGVTRRFGGLTAVDVDHLEVQRGIITGLIGPNGAGKTTFFNLLTGFDTPNEGRWTVDGDDVSGKPPHVLARKGVVRTFQLTKALSKLSVLDNMKLGAVGQAVEPVERVADVHRGERFGAALHLARERADECADLIRVLEALQTVARVPHVLGAEQRRAARLRSEVNNSQ